MTRPLGMFTAALALALSAPAADKRLVEGNPASVVRVMIFEDLQCSDCAILRQMLDRQILPRYAATVAFEHHDFPLPKHAWARQAAAAARFFEEIRPELAIEYRKTTLKSLEGATAENFNDRLAAFAGTHKVDPAKAIAASQDPRFAALVEKDYQDGIARGVQHTPTVFVNGEPFVETFTFEELSKAIDRALADSR